MFLIQFVQAKKKSTEPTLLILFLYQRFGLNIPQLKLHKYDTISVTKIEYWTFTTN